MAVDCLNASNPKFSAFSDWQLKTKLLIWIRGVSFDQWRIKPPTHWQKTLWALHVKNVSLVMK